MDHHYCIMMYGNSSKRLQILRVNTKKEDFFCQCRYLIQRLLAASTFDIFFHSVAFFANNKQRKKIAIFNDDYLTLTRCSLPLQLCQSSFFFFCFPVVIHRHVVQAIFCFNEFDPFFETKPQNVVELFLESIN